MTSRRLGRQTVALLRPPSVVSYANIGGKFEANGPLAGHFDLLCTDSFFGKDTWEQAESAMQQEALTRALEKGGLTPAELDYVLAGDLLNQCIGTAFGLRDFQIPFFGLYGACSTMGESLALGSLLISGGHARTAACMTSSHYCTAERQYRMKQSAKSLRRFALSRLPTTCSLRLSVSLTFGKPTITPVSGSR